ncbi:hypothetical protein ACIQMJ_09725 [Actinosynnema sp. NPDC091369]
MSDYAVFLAVTDRTAQREPTFSLTSLTIPADRLGEAEQRAASALAALPPDVAWPDVEPAVRRQVVDRVRRVPHVAVDHVEHDRPRAGAWVCLRACLADLATNSSLAAVAHRPHTVHLTGHPVPDPTAPLLVDAEAVHVDAEAHHPALARLTALLATAAPASVSGALPDDEDPYEAFDSYTLGGLAEAGSRAPDSPRPQ